MPNFGHRRPPPGTVGRRYPRRRRRQGYVGSRLPGFDPQAWRELRRRWVGVLMALRVGFMGSVLGCNPSARQSSPTTLADAKPEVTEAVNIDHSQTLGIFSIHAASATSSVITLIIVMIIIAVTMFCWKKAAKKRKEQREAMTAMRASAPSTNAMQDAHFHDYMRTQYLSGAYQIQYSPQQSPPAYQTVGRRVSVLAQGPGQQQQQALQIGQEIARQTLERRVSSGGP